MACGTFSCLFILVSILRSSSFDEASFHLFSSLHYWSLLYKHTYKYITNNGLAWSLYIRRYIRMTFDLLTILFLFSLSLLSAFICPSLISLSPFPVVFFILTHSSCACCWLLPFSLCLCVCECHLSWTACNRSQYKQNVSGSGRDLGQAYVNFTRNSMDQIRSKVNDELWILTLFDVIYI